MRGVLRSLAAVCAVLSCFALPASALESGGSETAAISFADELDTYTFSASAGDSIYLSAAGNIYVWMVLYAPSGQNLAGSSSTIELNSLAHSGTYTVTVRSYYAGQTGTYSIHHTRAPGANEHGTLSNGGMQSGSIAAGDLDSYSFTASAGDSLYLSVAGDIYFWMELYAPSGQNLANSSSTIEQNSLAQTGTYTVVIRSYYAYAEGYYDLHYTRAPGANEHGVLPNGGMRSGSLTSGDLDSYSFTASAGESFYLSVAGDIYFWMELYAPSGQNIANSSSTIEENSLAQTGTYTVVIRSYYSYAEGSYDLHYAKAPGANEHGAVANGSTLAGNVTPGDLDSYTVAAVAGSRLRLSVTGPVYMWMELYAPSGQNIANSGSTIDLSSVSQSGTYTIILRSYYSYAAGSYSVSASVDDRLLSYAALGDSYAAGEGVLPFFDDYSFLSGCHRSTLAYSTHVRVPGSGKPLAQRADAEFSFFACTGATTENVTAAGENHRDEPPQLAPENRVDENRELVTLTIGGNDAQFMRIIAYCLVHNHCNDLRPFGPHLDLELGDLFPLLVELVRFKLVNLYAEVKTAAPNAAIVVVDYPIVLGGNECWAVETPFHDESKLSAEEQAWLRDANRQLNDAIALAAAQIGVHYVPVADHFEGHGICGNEDDWIHGFFPVPPEASFHPTARGQWEYARVVNAYLSNAATGWPHGYFPSGLPRNPAALAPLTTFSSLNDPLVLPEFADLDVFLAAAPVGCSSAQEIVVPGTSARIEGRGFAPNEAISVTLVIGGQTIALGSVAADATGNLSATVSIPGNLVTDQVGTLEALGAGPNGAGYLALSTVRVEQSVSVDADGDGIPDGCDNSPLLANPDQADSDFDGDGDVGDVCPNEFIDDEDGDGLCNTVDTCPLDFDNDADGDGLCALADNCPTVGNANQADTDGDGIGNVCETLTCYALEVATNPATGGDVQTPAATCVDGRYAAGSFATLRAAAAPELFFTGWTGGVQSAVNPLSASMAADLTITAQFCATADDDDGDYLGNACDNCPLVANTPQTNTDGDSQGNACDADDDNDGLQDVHETGTGTYQSPTDTGTNPLVADTDGDGVPDGTEVANGSNPTFYDAPSSADVPLPLWAYGVLALLLNAVNFCRSRLRRRATAAA